MENTSELMKIDINKRNDLHKNYQNQILELLKLKNRVGCVLPTGTGKSYGIIQQLCKILNHKVLVLVNRLSLQEQYSSYSNSNIETKTYQSLLYINENDYISIFNKYEYIICDEAHHICHSNKWGRCLDIISKKCNIKLIGLTATENRSDGINVLNDFFCDGNTEPIYINTAIDMNILPEVTYVTALTEIEPDVKNDILKNLTQLERYKFENILNIPNILKEHIKNERLDNLKIILFVSRLYYIEQVNKMCQKWFNEAFPDYRINTYVQNSILAKTYNKSQLDEFIKKHDTKDIDILINVDMIGEGVHIKNVHTVIRFRHTKSMPKFIQEIGRCLNPYDENGTYMKGLVFDFLNDINRLYSRTYREFADELENNYTDMGQHNMIRLDGKIKVIPKLINFPEHIDKVIRDVLGKGLLRWTVTEDEELKNYYINEHKDEYEISKLNGRSISANRHRLQRLGVYNTKYKLKTLIDDKIIIAYMKENNGKYIKKHYMDKFGINYRHVAKLGIENNIIFKESIKTTGSKEVNKLKKLLNDGLDTQHMYSSEIYNVIGLNRLDTNAVARVQEYMKSNNVPFKKLEMRKYEMLYEYRKIKSNPNAKKIIAQKYNISISSFNQSVKKIGKITNKKLNEIIKRGYV